MGHTSDEALEPAETRVARTEARLARMRATRHDWARRVAEGRDEEHRRVEAAHLAGLDQLIAENERLLAFAQTLSDPRRDTEGAVDGRGFTVRVAPPRDERRTIAGRLSLAGEVAARQRAEAALLESEAWFREIADSLPAFIFLLGPDGRTTFLNKPLLDFLGIPEERLLGANSVDPVHPDDRRRVLDGFFAAFAARRPYKARYRLRRADGEYRWIHSEAEPRFSPDGAFLGYSASAVDVTENVRAEEALRETESRYRRIVETAAEGIWEIDAARRTTYVNRHVAALLGYTADEMLGRSTVDFLFPEDRPAAEQSWAARRRGGQVGAEWRLRRKDGGEVWVRNAATPLYAVDGTFVGSFTMLTDITAERRAAAALAEDRRRRAAGQEAERLRLARELHDGPLRALLDVGHALADRQQLAAGRGDAATAEDLGGLRRAVLGAMVELRAAIGVLRPPGLGEGWLPAALAGEVAVLRRAAEPDGPAIALAADPAGATLPEPTALALFRVAQEALRNAVRHAGARRIAVTLRCRWGGAALRIRDDGRGFAVPERLAALAEAGHYGLLGVAERVELAGGRLRVRSEPGAGTAVTVWLPPDRADGDATQGYPERAFR